VMNRMLEMRAAHRIMRSSGLDLVFGEVMSSILYTTLSLKEPCAAGN